MTWETNLNYSANAARAQTFHQRGFDLGRITAVNADTTYGVQTLAHQDAGGSPANYPAVHSQDPRRVYQVGDYVNLARVQGDLNKVEITGPAQYMGTSEPITVVHNVV